ncbi:MAG: threonylcarbamoyl-AMP synthase [Solobacterium sp.]|nr:threonylcarbamoyl-AMP synthase [Solobacterium sp.]
MKTTMKLYGLNELTELAELLRQDGVISVPTDTVYGVCARMDHEEAQENLRNIKHRPETKALPLMCADVRQIRQIALTDERSEKLITAFMPGPVTLVLKKREEVPAFVNGGMDTLAIRMASSKELEELIRMVGVPLYMTSANQSGQPVCTTPEEIAQSCPGLAGMMDGKPSFGQASTIIDCTQDDIRILRQGPVTMEMIENALKGE